MKTPSNSPRASIERKRHRARRGGVWLNLLATLFAVAILLAILSLGITRTGPCGSNRIQCMNNMRCLSIAMLMYEDRYRRLPGTINQHRGMESPVGYVPPLLAYLEIRDLDNDWNAGDRRTRFDYRLICASDQQRFGLNAPGKPDEHDALSYVVNGGVSDIRGLSDDEIRASGVCFELYAPPLRNSGKSVHRFAPQRSNLFMTTNYIQQHDGLSETLLVSENLDADRWAVDNLADARALNSFVWWPGNESFEAHPRSGPRLPAHPWPTILRARPSSMHEGGVNAAFCDGQVKFLNADLDYNVYRQMMTSNSKLWP